MKTHISRRQFVSATAVASLTFPSILKAKDTQKKIVTGVIGLSRGMNHAVKYMEASNRCSLHRDAQFLAHPNGYSRYGGR